MLLDGFNHVAVLTNDTDRLCDFYRAVFEASVEASMEMGDGGRFTAINLGTMAELNVFEVPGNDEAKKQTPMLGRGRIDHLALRAPSIEALEEIRARLIARGAADRFVTDFGMILSLFFRDPDGL